MFEKLFIIHCSASAWGNAAIIDSWHRARGWNGIGYHFVILNGELTSKAGYNGHLDGSIESGRPVGSEGAHTKGYNHKRNVGVCLIGKNGKFTPLQIIKLKKMCLDYQKRGYKIKFHSELDEKKPNCPGISITDMLIGECNA